MTATHDQEYAAVVDRERPLIQATAYLLTGDSAEAERVVQLVFAQLYGRWPGMLHPRVDAIRAVVHTARVPVHLRWDDRERFTLVDGPPPVPAAEPIVADLQMLTYEQRVAIVLQLYAELPSGQIAEILKRPVGEVLSRARHARAVLAAGQRARASDDVLVQELRAAIPCEMRESHGSADAPPLDPARVGGARRGGADSCCVRPARSNASTGSAGSTIAARPPIVQE
jgi:DNA-directed RNA polymerase specialized sigma24 family protein